MNNNQISIISTALFTKTAKKIFEKQELEELKAFLAARPEAGNVIQATGGARKLRWAARNKGKRGGARVIYYHYASQGNLYLLHSYLKSEKTDLTPAEKQLFKAAIRSLY